MGEREVDRKKAPKLTKSAESRKNPAEGNTLINTKVFLPLLNNRLKMRLSLSGPAAACRLETVAEVCFSEAFKDTIYFWMRSWKVAVHLYLVNGAENRFSVLKWNRRALSVFSSLCIINTASINFFTPNWISEVFTSKTVLISVLDRRGAP